MLRSSQRRRDIRRGLAGATPAAPAHVCARLLAAVVLLAMPMRAHAADPPVSPLISFFSHWDHHWYVWLRGDPTFEAVEIMSRDRGPGLPPVVWVFFTERSPPKRQTHYVNDPRLSAALGWQQRDISFTMSGAAGGPRNVSAALTDSANQPVSIAVEHAPGAQLSPVGGGLTDQSGHSSDKFILLFFRELAALTTTARVTVAGVERSQPRPDASFAAPFIAAHSTNILVGGFTFAHWSVAFEGATSDAVRFTRAGERWVATLRNQTVVEFDAGDDGALRRHAHRSGDHALVVRFEPSLPPLGRLAGGFSGSFAVSLDHFADLVTGSLRAATRPDGIALDWHFESPDWLKARSIRTTLTDDPGGTRVDVRPHAKP